MADRKQAGDLRNQMAEIDLEILGLLERRAHLAKEAGKLGEGSAMPLTREHERLRQLVGTASGELPIESVRTIFKAVFAACASLEGPTRVSFVGNDGSLGYVAARQLFGPGVRSIGHESAAQALDELIRGRVEYAIAPYETSAEGPVISTVLALKQTDLMVVGQCELSAGLSLMSRTGNLADIEKVYACAHDRANCQVFLNTSLPRASVIDVRSPALACQFAAEDHGGAAIAHPAVGDLHQLEVVVPNVGDEPELRMRYALIGTRPAPRTGHDVTSIVFTVNDEPGALLSVLGHFAKRGVNLKNIMSRPVPGELWDYVFYVQVVGHVTDRALVSALDEIKKNTKFIKVLGSYPVRS